MNGILFIDFNLVACDFLKFDWFKMLNGYQIFHSTSSPSEWLLYQSKRWKIEDDLKKIALWKIAQEKITHPNPNPNPNPNSKGNLLWGNLPGGTFPVTKLN